MKGYVKLLFVRAKGIWQLVYIGPLANFSGQPFSEMMETVPGNELESIFKENFSVLVFTDRGFVLYEPFKKKLLDYYRQHRKLQSHVEVVRFVSLKTN